ncbi:MAG TPA: indole-3-glycerol phosphate synthase TrpC [Geobacteraceae bacterium]|nr:indole-3-glycerol phosphate synthase TrpC [Geobacteraceae bacterium]
MADTPDILKKIFDHKKVEVAISMAAKPLDELRSMVADLPSTLGFAAALEKTAEAAKTAIIAEIKKGSPSKGVIRADFDPLVIAAIYAENGASCLSILTDSRFFMGDLAYIPEIRRIVDIPLLRKDFIFDPYQIFEARAAGADAILLIAAMLDQCRMNDLVSLARELGLDVLLEVHDEEELGMALETECIMIGINNRNLRTFETSLSTTERLAKLVPDDRLIVAESGINDREDILRLAKVGARAFLVGESLMREPDIGAKLRELQGML